MSINGKHEDLIYKNRNFIQELSKIQDLYFDTLFAELEDDGFPKDLELTLFDYIFNSNDGETFGEYLDR